MKTPNRKQKTAHLREKLVEPEKLTKKYRRQTKVAPPERRIVNRFRETHREPGVNPPRGQ